MKKALITGINGQDGAYLANLLLKKNYKIYGLIRRGSTNRLYRLEYLNIKDRINFIYGELNEFQNLQNEILRIKPDLIFNLAAQSFVKYSFDNPTYTYEINCVSVLNILECLRRNKLFKIKFYTAGTSEMFGNISGKKKLKIDEKTPMQPCSPYGNSKVAAHNLTSIYRESYGLFACSGILFNHESPLRGEEFVTKKIVKNLVEQKYSKKTILYLGNLDSKRDWGHAEDYVEAMYLMLKSKKPFNYVISTGKTYSVREFFTKVAVKLGFEPIFKKKGKLEVCIDKKTNRIIMKTSKKYFRENELSYLKGNSIMAKKKIGWKPKFNIDTLIDDMISYELKNQNVQK